MRCACWTACVTIPSKNWPSARVFDVPGPAAVPHTVRKPATTGKTRLSATFKKSFGGNAAGWEYLKPRAAKVRQEEYGRPDIRGFRPGDYYVRWMQRFGVLPESFYPATDRIDPYESDQAYWRSLWYQPPAVQTASAAGQDR